MSQSSNSNPVQSTDTSSDLLGSIGLDTALVRSGAASVASGNLESVWGAGHAYTLVAGGKAKRYDGKVWTVAEHVNNTAQDKEIAEWYVAVCSGAGHAAHAITFGADDRSTSEFSKHGKAHYANLTTSKGATLAALRKHVKALDVAATYGPTMEKVNAVVAKLNAKP